MLSGAIGVATYQVRMPSRQPQCVSTVLWLCSSHTPRLCVRVRQVMVGMLGMSTWMAAPVAVSLAIVGMEQTRTLHPPAAATGLIAVIGPQLVHDMGYWYVLMPCGVGSTALVLVGVMLNNLRPGVSYPKYWW